MWLLSDVGPSGRSPKAVCVACLQVELFRVDPQEQPPLSVPAYFGDWASADLDALGRAGCSLPGALRLD